MRFFFFFFFNANERTSLQGKGRTGVHPSSDHSREEGTGRGQRPNAQQETSYQLMSKLLGGTKCHLTNKSDLEPNEVFMNVVA
jgi:hypothetical protein